MNNDPRIEIGDSEFLAVTVPEVLTDIERGTPIKLTDAELWELIKPDDDEEESEDSTDVPDVDS